jgi:putative tricarboxylic transport membrane protein
MVMDNLLTGMELVLNWQVMVAIFAGVTIGLAVGALPGLGSVVALTMVLPFTFAMPTVPAIALILGVYCSSVFGGSYSAILLNTPGTPQSAATVLDGYTMAKKGEAGLALGWATGASVFGGIFSTFVLLAFAPQLAKFALSFGPQENFALTCLALTCIAVVAGRSMILGLLGGAIGLLVATVGVDPLSGETRMTFDVFAISSGLQLIPVLIGIFAIAEVLDRIAEPKGTNSNELIKPGFGFPKASEWYARKGTLIKSSIIGSLVGVLPGAGASTAAFVSYATAKRTGRFRKNIGQGEGEGIVASESANNAVTGGALVPTLALGIPGDPVTAVMMSALIIHGIQPGTRLFVDTPELIYSCFVALIVINIVMGLIAIPFARVFSRILSLPQEVLLTLIVVLSLLGAYGVRGNSFDLLVMFVAGVVGYLFRRIGIPAAPIVIGMVLGPFVEENLRQGLILTDGSYLQLFKNPIAFTLAVSTLAIIIVIAIKQVREMKSKTLN